MPKDSKLYFERLISFKQLFRLSNKTYTHNSNDLIHSCRTCIKKNKREECFYLPFNKYHDNAGICGLHKMKINC